MMKVHNVALLLFALLFMAFTMSRAGADDDSVRPAATAATHAANPLGDDPAVADGDDSTELARLLQTIQKHTDIATKNRMNADYVPGMVTVFKGEELEAQGMESVKDVVDSVNGLKSRLLDLDSDSNSLPAIGLFYKWMLNHTSVDLLSSRQIVALLKIPISVVERIEIIQGSNSQIHGHSAAAGLIHIITRRSGGRIVAGVHNEQRMEGFGVWSSTSASGSNQMSLAFAGWQEEKRDRESGLFITRTQVGKSGNLTSLDSDPSFYRSGFFNLELGKKTNISINYLEFKDKTRFQAPSADGDVVRTLGGQQKKAVIAIRHDHDMKSGAQAELYANFHHHLADEELLNPLFIAGSTTLNAEEVFRHYIIRENNLAAGIDLKFKSWKGHKLLGSVQARRTWLDWDDKGTLNAPTPSQQSRLHWSVGLQDQFNMTKATTVTAGIRFDQFDKDAGSHLSPHLALVYRIDPVHLLKAQYARNTRPISRDEVVDGVTTPQTTDTVELGYIYRTPEALGRMTLFHAWHHDITGFDAGVDNSARMVGLEANGEYTVNSRLKLDGRLAFSVPKGEGITDSEKPFWDLESGLSVTPKKNWWVDLRMRHHQENTARYTTTYLSVIRKNFLHDDLELKGRVRNILLLQAAGTEGTVDAMNLERTWAVDLTYRF